MKSTRHYLIVLGLIIVGLIIWFFSMNDINMSDDIDINPEKIVYFEDERTGIIYGIVGSRKSGNPISTGLGITVIPEEYHDKVRPYLVKIDK